MSGIVLMSLALAMVRAGDQSSISPAPSAPVASQVEDGTHGTRLFISPMGEPFRADRDPQDIWFDRADANHDGALSRDEFDKDSDRWFARLDRRNDGEVDPEDIEYYESVLAPEIRVDAYEGATAGGGDNGTSRPATRLRIGAAHYSYFDYPEPVMVADTNFNRGVDPREFRRAAVKRFDMLDTNGDGKIERGELPRISALVVRRAEKKNKHRD